MSYQQIHSDQRDEIFIEPQDRETRPRYRGILATTAALLLIGMFAGGLWFAYQQGLRHASVAIAAGDVPLIRADERPTKVKPDNPGGMEIPDRDKLIYTQKRAAVEHLLPPPEKPIARPAGPPAPAPQAATIQPPAAPDASGVGVAPPTIALPVQPQQPAAKPTGKNPPPAVSSRTAREAPAHPNSARIQLGSVRSEEAARHEWERVRRANSDLLGNLSATPVRADLGQKGIFYRIQTGPIGEADRICAELKQRNIGCIIAR